LTHSTLDKDFIFPVLFVLSPIVGKLNNTRRNISGGPLPEASEKQSPQAEESRPDQDRLAIPSAKKLQANRENAKKSTGPRT